MRVLVISDTHAPFHHPGTLDFLADLRRAYKPETVVHIGDLGDQLGWSRYTRPADAPGQADELDQCRSFCKQLYTLFPAVSACVGNHDERLVYQASRHGIPSSLVASVREIYESPEGWVWMRWHVIEGVIYQHGTGFTGRDCAFKHALVNMQSSVCGHVHSSFQIRYQEGIHGGLFGCNVGCLVDPRATAMRYAREFANRPKLGCAVVTDGKPELIPMPNDMVDAVRYTQEEAIQIRPAMVAYHDSERLRQQAAMRDAGISKPVIESMTRKKKFEFIPHAERPTPLSDDARARLFPGRKKAA